MTSDAQKNAGYPLPPDSIQEILDAPLIPFCGMIPDTRYTRAALQGAVFELAKWWNWDKSYRIGDRRAAETAGYLLTILIQNFRIGDACSMPGITGIRWNECNLEYTFDGTTWFPVYGGDSCVGGSLMLRQNTGNNCLLEQSQDGGTTWTTAFNFGLCASGESSTTNILNQMLLQQEINNYVQNNQNTWNNNPTVNNFAPTLVYDGTEKDINRNLALCVASQAIWTIIFEAVIENYDTGFTAETISYIAGIVGAAIGAFAGFVFTGGAGAAVGAAIGAIVSSEGMKLFFQAEFEIDRPVIESLQDPYTCAIYNALKDDNLSRSNFETALSGFDEYPYDYFAPAFTYLLEDIDVWLAFLDLAKTAMEYQEYNLPLECPCDEEQTWTHTIDLTASNGGFVAGLGTWVSGAGWHAAAYPPNNNTVAINLDMGQTAHITRLSFTATVAPAWATRVQIRTGIYPSGSIVFDRLYSPGVAVTDDYVDVDGSVLFVNYSQTSSNSAGNYTGYITSCTIEGMGANPFI